jgi:hypothetical protein
VSNRRLFGSRVRRAHAPLGDRITALEIGEHRLDRCPGQLHVDADDVEAGGRRGRRGQTSRILEHRFELTRGPAPEREVTRGIGQRSGCSTHEFEQALTLGEVAFDRDHVEAALGREEARDAMAQRRELARAMRPFAESDDARLADHRLQWHQVGEVVSDTRGGGLDRADRMEVLPNGVQAGFGGGVGGQKQSEQEPSVHRGEATDPRQGSVSA